MWYTVFPLVRSSGKIQLIVSSGHRKAFEILIAVISSSNSLKDSSCLYLTVFFWPVLQCFGSVYELLELAIKPLVHSLGQRFAFGSAKILIRNRNVTKIRSVEEISE